MQLKCLTIFTPGVINRKETSHKTLISVRPENPVLVPFDWTTTAVWIVQEQTVVMNVTDGGADLKSRANNSSSHSTEARRQAYDGRNEGQVKVRTYNPTAYLLIDNSVAYQVTNNVQQFFVMVYFFKERMNH